MNNLLEKVGMNSSQSNSQSQSRQTQSSNYQYNQSSQSNNRTNININNGNFFGGNTPFNYNFTNTGNPNQATINFGGNTFCLNNPNDINSFISNILSEQNLGGLFSGMGFNNMTTNVNQGQNQGQNIYTNVYSNVNGNSNNINFNEEIINQNQNQSSNEEAEYLRQIKELKNYKYKQLVRGKYSEYIKVKKQNSTRTINE